MAHKLLTAGKAAVFRRYPFTIILKKVVIATPQLIILKLDPGSQTTGMALVQDEQVIFGAELTHRSQTIKDATAVNSTRWALFNRLKETGLPISTGSGGLTKFNRTRLNLPKTHWLDAACVGKVNSLQVLTSQPLLIKATGHGSRQMCRTDKFGFPSRYVPRLKFVKGFQTGDIVKAIVSSGHKVGTYIGRVAVRTTGSFNISLKKTLVQGISHKYCSLIHRKDGYLYAT